MKSKNDFLLEVGRESRKNRRKFWDDNEISIRFSKFRGNPEAGLWFKTRGCSYDHKGGCLMCDYSIGSPTSATNMIEYVKKGLKQIEHPCHQLLVSPSGSMLDEIEVPQEALEGILELLRDSPHELFSFETRADSITEEKIHLCKHYLGDRFWRLFIGLECANDWIRKYCVNKQLLNSDFIKVVRILKKHNVKIAANILVDIPFLSNRENIELAVSGVKWAIELGVDECFLFSVHIKNDTPLKVLYDNNIFRPSSLWAIVEIITRLGPDYYKHIRLSWYTSYGAYNVVASPSTCSSCYQAVLKLIEAFAETQEKQYIDALNSIDCRCKREFYREIEKTQNVIPIQERVYSGYEVLACKTKGMDWWKCHKEKLFTEMLFDAEESLCSSIGGNVFGKQI